MTAPTAAAREKAREIAHLHTATCWPSKGNVHGDACNRCTADITAALLAAEQRGREAAVPAWQPISTAPKDGMYIIANARGEVCPYRCRDGEGVVQNTPGFQDWTFGEVATHWQPLPAAPHKGADDAT